MIWIHRAETERGLSRKHIIEGKIIITSQTEGDDVGQCLVRWFMFECLFRFTRIFIETAARLRGHRVRQQKWRQQSDGRSVNDDESHGTCETITCVMSLCLCFAEIVRAMTFVINQGMAMYWGTSRWSAMEIMVTVRLYGWSSVSVWHSRRPLTGLFVRHQEAYSVARQFNLIPPVCEQAEYHYFQRDKVEVQLPELYHKIGQTSVTSQLHVSPCVWLHLASLLCFFSPSGVGAMTWSPLACGLITGKYSDGVPECSRAAMKVSLIRAVAQWSQTCVTDSSSPLKGYQWLKERVNSEEGRRQLAKIKELHLLADRLGCTAAQLAIGTRENIMRRPNE